MVDYLYNRLVRSKKINFVIYQYRFLFCYIIFCGMALICELLLVKVLIKLGSGELVAKSLSLLAGIFLAFILNVKFNFKVPANKLFRSFLYFTLISIGSAILNHFVRVRLNSFNWSYSQSRLIVAVLCFGFAYVLHRKFSFKSYKKVGVAIYANGREDVEVIFNKIYYFTDFIHIDIVDESFLKNIESTDLSQLQDVRRKWGDKEIHVHIMSINPSQYLDLIYNYVDVVIIHDNIDEDIKGFIKKVQVKGLKVGLSVGVDCDLEKIQVYLSDIEIVQVLSIDKPGFSGQQFNEKAYSIINILNESKSKHQFSICVDGGVNLSNIGKLDVEYVVSGSCVLNSEDPPLQIRRLQTSLLHEDTSVASK